jgi:hypothetical protein
MNHAFLDANPVFCTFLSLEKVCFRLPVHCIPADFLSVGWETSRKLSQSDGRNITLLPEDLRAVSSWSEMENF